MAHIILLSYMSSMYFENELDIEFRGVPHTVKFNTMEKHNRK